MQTMTDSIDDCSNAARAPDDARESGARTTPPATGAPARAGFWLRFVEHGWPQGVPPCIGWGA